MGAILENRVPLRVPFWDKMDEWKNEKTDIAEQLFFFRMIIRLFLVVFFIKNKFKVSFVSNGENLILKYLITSEETYHLYGPERAFEGKQE